MATSPPHADRHVAALVRSLEAVPPEAVPAIVDCGLASSSLSPDTLFSFLLNSFPDSDSTEDISSYNFASHSAALCHLINGTNSPSCSMRQLVQRVFIPVLKQIDSNEPELLNQVIISLCGASSKFNLWEVLEDTLIPLCLRSIYDDMGLITQNIDSVVYQGSTANSMKQVYLQPVNAIRLLASVAASALQKSEGRQTSKIVSTLALELSTLMLEMLRQLPNYVATAIRVLFPVVLCLVNEVSGALVCIHGKEFKVSCFSFMRDAWECCIVLFPLGNLERLHAYSILVQSLSFFSKSATNGGNQEEFVMLTKKSFGWRYAKDWLLFLHLVKVDRDSLVRKKALYLLKVSLKCYFLSTTTCVSQLSNNIDSLSDMDAPACMTSESGAGSRGHATVTKRERWANEEAKSMGVGEASDVNGSCTNSQDIWTVFILLYEMLEEFGTHLIEAAWTHQVGLLIESSWHNRQTNQSTHSCYQDDIIHMRDIFYWMAVLWERGFCHENPQVRCLIMESFLQTPWEKHARCAQKVSTDFVLGPLLRGLNDVVHHKDFGIGGTYNSKTIEGATEFFSEYTSQLSLSDRMYFVWSLASAARQDNFGRAGLMALSFCIASSSCHFNQHKSEYNTYMLFNNKFVTPVELLDALGIVIERSKQHFNPNYRLQVCEKILEATSYLISASEVPLDLILHFLATIPREFTDITGKLRGIVQKWLVNGSSNTNNSPLVKEVTEFPITFLKHGSSGERSYSDLFDDEDALAWEYEAQRWARMLFLGVLEEQQLDNIFVIFQSHESALHDLDCNSKWRPVKFLILMISFVEEHQRGCIKRKKSDFLHDIFPSCQGQLIDTLVSILENLVAFAGTACSILWSEDNIEEDSKLPSSIKGKLGGPSLRRLPLSLTPSVLQAIFSMKAISCVLSWCCQFKQDYRLENSIKFLWDFSWRVIRSPTCKRETGAELQLAAFESLSHVVKSPSTSFSSPVHARTNQRTGQLNGMLEEPSLNIFVLGFLESVNCLLANGALSRSRRAVLMSWKWLCMEALLSIPGNAPGEETSSLSQVLSDSTLRSIFLDIVESLEHTAESSVLSILKCVRLVLGLAKKHHEAASSWLDPQMVMHLVKSSWMLHESCNKRRVAPLAALLSAVIHRDIFSDLEMHESSKGQKGPLKWFVEKLLDEGSKSPRTIRLAALHLTGLWLLYPETTKYYIRELKLLSLYGSVAFDEDFEGELSENQDAKAEVSMLAQSPDCEFTEAFINTELYARVSVAVLFYQFANFSEVVETIGAKDCLAAVHCGKLFLLELLDSAVNDKDISKELYKKYSSVHRRKVRAWQMICVLSHFVDDDNVKEVTTKLHLCLYRTNLPAVRQYLETFATQVYLKFPDLVEQQLLPIFHNYAMRTQALSSYVFIAANVILHSKELSLQVKHLKGVLPSVIPLLTSHHHSLRGFTQLLVHRVLNKLWPLLELENLEAKSFERKCFEDLKVYLAENPDCARLRASMEDFFDNFDPNVSSSPAGVFSRHHEGSDFECVPISLMDQVVDFLNEARDELRHSVAKDLAIIKSGSFSLLDSNVKNRVKDITIDFQKKITLDMGKSDSDLPPLLLEMEREDQLFNSVLKSRSEALERIKQNQQNLIIVASLVDRIPNLAGLARTCEVFKASGLALADTTILRDKQFQLISVTAEKWLPLLEVPVSSVKAFLEIKRREGYSIIGLEQTANSTPLDQFSFPKKTVLVLGHEKEGIPVDIIHILDTCVEIPQLGIVRSLNVHVSGAIAVWEYTRQQRSLQ